MNKGLPCVRVIRPGAYDKVHRVKNIHKGIEIHRAHWVMSRPDNIIENGYICIENGIIVEVDHINPCSAFNSDSEVMVFDHGDGVIMPGLVNAHFHLELSALKGRLPFNYGFNAWVRELLKQRENIGNKKLSEQAEKALKGLINSGSLSGAEISTLGITKDIVKNSQFFGIWFQEMLGSLNSMDALDAIKCMDSDFFDVDKTSSAFPALGFSLAGHAPHTSSPRLLKAIKKFSASKGLGFSIHAAESEDESEFITTAKGQWASFLTERNIDFSSWPIPSATPVDYLFKLGLLDPLTILVHLLNINDKDFEIIADSGAKIVLCPRSNINLHKQLPDIEKFLKMGMKPALGTDSLASCDSLSIFDEMAFVAEHFLSLSPIDIINMATINGAYVLGMDKTAGSLEPGKMGDCLYLPLKISNSENLPEEIISGLIP